MSQPTIYLDINGTHKRLMNLYAYLKGEQLFVMPLDVAQIPLLVSVRIVSDTFRSLGYRVLYKHQLKAVLLGIINHQIAATTRIIEGE